MNRVVKMANGQQPPAEEGRLGDDLLIGAQAIADELGEPVRRARYMLDRGYIPGTKVGQKWYSRRSLLRARFDEHERPEK